MPEKAQLFDLIVKENAPLSDEAWLSLLVALRTEDLLFQQDTLLALYKPVLASCRENGEAVAALYLDVRRHFKTIFAPQDVDHALNSYIDLCESTFMLEESTSGADIRLLSPYLDSHHEGIDLAHHLLTHPEERVIHGIFGALLGRVYWWGSTSQERIDAQTCLRAFSSCEVVGELATALHNRDRAFEVRYLIEDRLGDTNVTPLFVCPVPDTTKPDPTPHDK